MSSFGRFPKWDGSGLQPLLDKRPELNQENGGAKMGKKTQIKQTTGVYRNWYDWRILEDLGLVEFEYTKSMRAFDGSQNI